jgi:hypothetical protein
MLVWCYGRAEKCTLILVEKTKGRRPFGRYIDERIILK